MTTTRTVVASLLLAATAAVGTAAAADAAPTAADAEAFVRDAEARLLEHWIRSERAAWVQANFITQDTEAIAAQEYGELMAVTAELAKASVRFDGLDVPYDVARKIRLIKTSLPLAAPADPQAQAELARLATEMEGMYGRGKYCPEGAPDRCMDLEQLSHVLEESRDPDELLDAWVGWRTVARPMRAMYARFVELGDRGAGELGFTDLGAMWRSGYDMPPDAFAAELDRLWGQVRPLYEALHCHVRAKLAERYGTDLVPLDAPIPAHLLGNMWAQDWSHVYDLVMPQGEAGESVDMTALLRARNVDALGMVRYGEAFFSSLGFEPLPETFWRRSLFVKPRDRDVVCHASAWDIDWKDDLRIKMCIEVDGEDFATIHHELGHNYYQRAYNRQPPLYRDGANDGFHEGIGDTLALSITPSYLAEIGLLPKVPEDRDEIGRLMRTALDKVAFLPFGLLIDQWRWKVFSGEIPPARYNGAWWDLRKEYQGIRSPVARTEADFDPGAKYHVPANTPYSRYFLAAILQFQFHKALCDAAGYEGPLDRCSIYGNAEAGRRLRAMMQMGQSRPWPDALEAIAGTRALDAEPLLEYFAPLRAWLDRQNRGRTCGW